MSQDHSAEIDSPTMTDLDALVELWIDLAAGQRQHDSHLEAEANRDRIRESLARQIALSEVRVARHAGRIVGFVSFTIEGSTFARSTTKGLIQNIYVEPDAREQGIGSRLLERAETVLDAEGADVVALDVMADNEAGRRFYRRQGYDSHRLTLEKSTESDTS
jgi:ribosomal protein S18 acetylase RimI-like enzyme